MIISVINHTNGELTDEEVQVAIRAINRQIADDFEPYWSLGGRLRLEGPVGSAPQSMTLAEMRGDAVIYLWNQNDFEGAIGYHDSNNKGIPFGFVFTEVSRSLGENWSVTLSHEALELIGDPEVNLLVRGRHPRSPGKYVFHWYEMCDAVQAEAYEIDGVEVSNFLLPLYFTSGEEEGGRNDFLGRRHGGKSLRSFGVNPGGYIGYYNPESGQHETYARRGDLKAEERLHIKAKAGFARRALRYQGLTRESFLKRRPTTRRKGKGARTASRGHRRLG